jgi:hypothetical protein
LKINLERINQKRAELENHSLLVTNVIQSQRDLKIFMENHVYAVWDFMSLTKSIQHAVVPSSGIWLPTRGNRSNIARMINEIILCEESDCAPGNSGSISHFDLYLQAMLEVGADIKPVTEFLDNVTNGADPTDPIAGSTKAGRRFMTTTFDILKQGDHCVAAAFAYGRETIIPSMFTRILTQMRFTHINAPRFFYYLDRHIEVDGGEHGPMSEQLVEYFCKDDPLLIYEAEQAALKAIDARIQFFNDIEILLN